MEKISLRISVILYFASLFFGSITPAFGTAIERDTTLTFKAEANRAFAADVASTTQISGDYAIITGPAWLSMTSQGILFGTPTNSEVGTHKLYFSAVKAGKEFLFKALLSVVVSSSPDKFEFEAKVDQVFKIDLARLTGKKGEYSFYNLPGWLEALPSGVLVGSPELADVGEFEVRVSVKTTADSSETFLIKLHVIAPPSGVPEGFIARVGEHFDLDVFKLIGLPGTYRLLQAPFFLSFSDAGILHGDPNVADLGSYAIRVSVQRGFGEPVVYSFNVNVLAQNP